MPRTAIYRHSNNTDALDAIVLTEGAWTADGAVAGVNTAEPTKYVFTGLADDTAYEVRIRAGGSPAESDLPIAPIPVSAVASGDSAGVETLLERITAPVKTADEADADQQAVLDAIAGSGLFPVTVLTPEQASGRRGKVITIVQGDDYTGVRKLPIELETEADLVGQFVILALSLVGDSGASYRSEVYEYDGKQYFDFDPSGETTAAMETGDWKYIARIEAVVGAESQIASGILRVNGFASPLPIQGVSR